MWLHIVHNSFEHGKKRSNWCVKLLNAIFKIFDDSPSHLVDFEKLTFSSIVFVFVCIDELRIILYKNTSYLAKDI